MNKETNKVIAIDLGGVNSYLICTENGFVLVDTGGHLTMDKIFDNRRKKLIESLNSLGCRKSNLKLVILTHGDNDHSANAAFIKKEFGVPIAMHPGDIRLVEDPTLDTLMESFKYESQIFKIVFRLMKKKIEKMTQKTLEDYESFTPNILLSDKMDLKDFGIDGTVIYLPGHTNGSIGILLEDGSFIAGDIFINNKKPDVAPNAVDFKKLYESIGSLKNYKIGTVYPGHGHPFAFSDYNR